MLVEIPYSLDATSHNFLGVSIGSFKSIYQVDGWWRWGLRRGLGERSVLVRAICDPTNADIRIRSLSMSLISEDERTKTREKLRSLTTIATKPMPTHVSEDDTHRKGS